MNLAGLDREALEAIVLAPPDRELEPLRCSEAMAEAVLPKGNDARTTRLRHVLAAAHELLVRIASTALTGRSLLDRPEVMRDYLRIVFAGAEREAFVVVFLDAHLRVIAAEQMFAGTLTQTSVFPREIVRAALRHNAHAVVLSHVHPSGLAEPSRADEHLTQSIKAALALVDVRVIDHVVVGTGGATTSFAERGLL
jgi:DNA repair protein RadC